MRLSTLELKPGMMIFDNDHIARTVGNVSMRTDDLTATVTFTDGTSVEVGIFTTFELLNNRSTSLANRAAVKNRPIAELLAQYTEENCDFTNMDSVVRVAQRYVQTMPDDHVRCLLHVLAEHVATQQYQLLMDNFTEVCGTRDRFVKRTCDLRRELAALKGEPDPYGPDAPQDNRCIKDYETWDTTIRELYPQQSRDVSQDGSILQVWAHTGTDLPPHAEQDEVGFWNLRGNVGAIY